MEEKIYMASCPVCGRSLFKGRSNSYIEGGCPKCKKYLQISFTEDGVVSCVADTRESVSEHEKNS